MPENLENTINEAVGSKKERMNESWEIAETPKLDDIVASLSRVEDSLSHDTPVVLEDLQKVDKALRDMTLDIEGDSMAVEELLKVKNLGHNMGWWEKIRQGDEASLYNISFLPANIASYLRSRTTREIIRTEVPLSDKAIEHLSKSRIPDLTIEVPELSQKAAEHLSGFKGESLCLEKLEKISDAAAEALGKRVGDLSLQDLRTVSAEGLKSISRVQGDLLFLSLRTLTKEGAEALGSHKGDLFLGGLDYYTLTKDIAEGIAKCKGRLTLRDVRHLDSEDVVEALSKHEGDLMLDGLHDLSSECAKKFSKHNGLLSLRSFIKISDEILGSLVQNEGGLSLGLIRLSESAVGILLKHKGTLFLPSYSPTPAVRKIFEDAGKKVFFA